MKPIFFLVLQMVLVVSNYFILYYLLKEKLYLCKEYLDEQKNE